MLEVNALCANENDSETPSLLPVFIQLHDNGAWQNSEVASRAGHFEIELKYDFFQEFLLKTHYYPAYYIMAD